MSILLEAEHLTKTFTQRGKNPFKAVNDVSFTLKKGETLGIVGESGSGKSTIAKLLTRLTDITEGTVKVVQVIPVKEGIVSEETSKEIREILETVVSQGSGKNAKIEGYAIGGKTATSQTLPRSANRYISSFLGFAPAEDPQILGLCIIHDPKGIYYGGTVAAPVIRGIFENILPYLGIEKSDVSDFSAEGN